MNKFQILVVEDDPPIRNLIATTLKTHEYKYLLAKNGEEAILQASSYAPDVVFLDLGLPDIDGVEIIKRIREWSNMPIIVISARSEDEDKIEALDAGADDYLTKPFSVEELLARLRVMQRRIALLKSDSEINEKSVYTNGRLKIDYYIKTIRKKQQFFAVYIKSNLKSVSVILLVYFTSSSYMRNNMHFCAFWRRIRERY